MSFFFSSRRRHTRYWRDWSSDVCSSDLASLGPEQRLAGLPPEQAVLALPDAVLRGLSPAFIASLPDEVRSEERRVGKECRCRGSAHQTKKIARNGVKHDTRI